MKREVINKIVRVSTGVAAAFVLSEASTQAQNLLVNGDFESASGFTANPITATSGPGGVSGVNCGWALFGDATWIIYQHDLLVQNVPGNNWTAAGAYQIVAPLGGITAGDTYTLSGYTLTDTGTTWGPTPVDYSISFVGAWNGTTYPALTSPSQDPKDGGFNFSAGLNTWTYSSTWSVAPAGAYGAIVYAMCMDGGQTTTENVYFSNLSLTVPEPSSLALLGMGLTAVPFYFIRRRKS